MSKEQPNLGKSSQKDRKLLVSAVKYISVLSTVRLRRSQDLLGAANNFQQAQSHLKG